MNSLWLKPAEANVSSSGVHCAELEAAQWWLAVAAYTA